MVTPDVPEQQTRGSRNASRHQPQRPGRQEYKMALLKHADRIFEEDFEHEVAGSQPRSKYRRGGCILQLQTPAWYAQSRVRTHAISVCACGQHITGGADGPGGLCRSGARMGRVV